MTLHLSLSTNPLINRIAEPEDMVRICADEIGIQRLQISNEFINPGWPAEVRKRFASQFTKAGARHGLRATSVMTGAQGRQNNMTHPDAEVRAWTVDWMSKLGEIAADLGAVCVGSQYGIMTWRDYNDSTRRDALIEEALNGWEDVWNNVSKLGLEYVYWEPMSVGRELGHTIAATAALNERVKARGLPLKIILDVDHGDLQSGNPDDTDPYKWIEALAADSPMIHVKQSHAINKSGHNPFTEQFNAEGRIHATELVPALQEHGPDGMEICLELSFRERQPWDNRDHVVDTIRRSVEYWAPHVSRD